MAKLTPQQLQQQERYRDARFTGRYDQIWQSVGKCVFCDLHEEYIFFEEHGVVMTISLYAYIDGHCMIVPRRHVRSAKELTDVEWQTIRKFTYLAKKLIKQVHGVKGMQLIQKDGAEAQSTVDHIHFHCVPFDSPDLLTWNYRKLRYTPLENVALYKQVGTKLVSAAVKFQAKYRHSTALPIICDVIIMNAQQQILFLERTAQHQLIPNYITLPGGMVDDVSAGLEQELVREIAEETGLTVAPKDLELCASQIDAVTHRGSVRQLAVMYPLSERCLRNTYVLKLLPEVSQLRAGDDAEALRWIDAAQAAKHPRISPSTKAIIQKVLI